MINSLIYNLPTVLPQQIVMKKLISPNDEISYNKTSSYPVHTTSTIFINMDIQDWTRAVFSWGRQINREIWWSTSTLTELWLFSNLPQINWARAFPISLDNPRQTLRRINVACVSWTWSHMSQRCPGIRSIYCTVPHGCKALLPHPSEIGAIHHFQAGVVGIGVCNSGLSHSALWLN